MKKKLNFDILESLRGLAALYVCIGHCRGVLWIGGEYFTKLHPTNTWTVWDHIRIGLNMLTRLSTEFVIVFFVLSGFSIAHSLRTNRQPAPFYKRRFIRLYPPYVGAIIWAMVAVSIISAVYPHFTDGTYRTDAFNVLHASQQLFQGKVIIKNLLYLPQLDGVLKPFWSLTQEVIFYLIAPFVFRKKNLYYALSVALFIAAIVGLKAGWIQPTIPVLFITFNIYFVIGSALYDHYAWVEEKLRRFLTKKTMIAFVLVTYFVMIALSLIDYVLLNALVAAALSVALIVYLLSKDIQIKSLIGIGRFSYTLYITHMPTIYLYMMGYFLVTQAAPPYIYNNLVFIPCVFLCLGFAWLHYSLIEKRSKVVLDKMRKKHLQTRQAAVKEKAVAVENRQW